jgi:hypothetical protein
MARKISFLILSVAILVTGITGLNKLGYWDRSVRIFSFNSDVPIEGRGGRDQGDRGFEGREGRGGREGFTRPEMRELPDSIRARFEAAEGRHDPGIRDSNIPDSLRQQFGPGNGERVRQDPSEGGVRPGERRERGEFRGGKKINLRNVLWFLAVFASFTVIVIYMDKGYFLICKKKSAGKKSDHNWEAENCQERDK